MKKIFYLLMLLPFGLFGQNDFVRHIITPEGEVTFWRGTQQLWVSSITSPPVYKATYYVAPWGDDDDPGTFEEPWQSWQKGFYGPDPGDTCYFRGGEYEPINGAPLVTYAAVYLSAGQGGTYGNPKNMFAYPGEVPILNCYTEDRSINYGVFLQQADYMNIKGLHIKNALQETDGTPEGKGFYFDKCNGIVVENCVAYDIDGGAFGAFFGLSDTTQFINCDAYSCYDPYTQAPNEPGGNADGFIFYDNDSLSYITVNGCRSWYNSDDGFDTFWSSGIIRYDSCWSFNNGYVAGNGFKLGPTHKDSVYISIRLVQNCISAQNGVYGFTQNAYERANWVTLHNNVAYLNGNDGFDLELRDYFNVVRNNIGYLNEGDQCDLGSETISDHNTWDDGAPTLTTADFVSLDVTQLDNPRQADGSLPVITCFHLAEGSDLIDAGVDVGLDYEGDAPDIGYAESNY